MCSVANDSDIKLACRRASAAFCHSTCCKVQSGLSGIRHQTVVVVVVVRGLYDRGVGQSLPCAQALRVPQSLVQCDHPTGFSLVLPASHWALWQLAKLGDVDSTSQGACLHPVSEYTGASSPRQLRVSSVLPNPAR